ncbi:MAG TPA: hypothetical protein VFK85_04120 [Anaeromyxobacteraceae bacterium]|nr:hypothetical protein [Anaeromyxobacteraceae bacterium]
MLVVMAGGCATARPGIAEQERVDAATGPFGKVLVVAMSRRPDVRDHIERVLAESLGARGVNAVTAVSYFALSEEPPSRDEVRAIVERDRFDGVLVARLAARGTQYRQAPVAPGDPFWMRYGFYDYYWGAWPYVYSPSYLERVRLVALELRLFGGAGADGRLVFRATSDEFELADASRAVDSVAADFAKHLADAGLVPQAARADVPRDRAQLTAMSAAPGFERR